MKSTSRPLLRSIAAASKVTAMTLAAIGVSPFLPGCSSNSSSTTCSDPLGTVWNETEALGECPSTWTRQGIGSMFTDDQHSCGVTATLTISIIGNSVSVSRTNSSDGNDCTYTGTLNADCTSASGTYSCTQNNQLSGPWSATIVH